MVTVLFSWVMVAWGVFPRDPFNVDHPLTAFIWTPNVLSYIVGFLAGIAGVLSLTSASG